MKKTKRVTRKQLLKEPDEFITTTGRIIQALQRYQRPLTIVAGVVVAAGLLAGAVHYYLESRERAAFALGPFYVGYIQ